MDYCFAAQLFCSVLRLIGVQTFLPTNRPFLSTQRSKINWKKEYKNGTYIPAKGLQNVSSIGYFTQSSESNESSSNESSESSPNESSESSEYPISLFLLFAVKSRFLTQFSSQTREICTVVRSNTRLIVAKSSTPDSQSFCCCCCYPAKPKNKPNVTKNKPNSNPSKTKFCEGFPPFLCGGQQRTQLWRSPWGYWAKNTEIPGILFKKPKDFDCLQNPQNEMSSSPVYFVACACWRTLNFKESIDQCVVLQFLARWCIIGWSCRENTNSVRMLESVKFSIKK